MVVADEAIEGMGDVQIGMPIDLLLLVWLPLLAILLQSIFPSQHQVLLTVLLCLPDCNMLVPASGCDVPRMLTSDSEWRTEANSCQCVSTSFLSSPVHCATYP
jgi:hypothetical protein